MIPYLQTAAAFCSGWVWRAWDTWVFGRGFPAKCPKLKRKSIKRRQAAVHVRACARVMTQAVRRIMAKDKNERRNQKHFKQTPVWHKKHDTRCWATTIKLYQFMLTAEYDGRCRAHDAEERPVNWICFRSAHFFYHKVTGFKKKEKNLTKTLRKKKKNKKIMVKLKRIMRDERRWRRRRRRTTTFDQTRVRVENRKIQRGYIVWERARVCEWVRAASVRRYAFADDKNLRDYVHGQLRNQ